VKDFLKDFLSDRRVVEVSRPIWMLILHGIILTFRTPRVTEAYQSIWGDGASPLRLITRSQAKKLQQKIQSTYPDDAIEVCYTMTYSGPSLKQRVVALGAKGIEHIMMLPLYPQYSATITGSIYDHVAAINQSRRNT
jgi:ferrochelatase